MANINLPNISFASESAQKKLQDPGYTVFFFSRYHCRIGEGIDIYFSDKKNYVTFVDKETGHRNEAHEDVIVDALGEYIWNGRKQNGVYFKNPYF